MSVTNSIPVFIAETVSPFLGKKAKAKRCLKYIECNHMVRHPRCVFINYNWINQLSNTTMWWLDICCLLHDAPDTQTEN